MVVALTDTSSAAMPIAAASVRRIASMCGFTFGRCRQSVQSTLPMRYPFAESSSTVRRNQNFAVDSLEIVRCVGKMQADIAERCCAQQGVAQRMDHHVTVRMGDATRFMLDFYSAEPQF